MHEGPGHQLECLRPRLALASLTSLERGSRRPPPAPLLDASALASCIGFPCLGRPICFQLSTRSLCSCPFAQHRKNSSIATSAWIASITTMKMQSAGLPECSASLQVLSRVSTNLRAVETRGECASSTGCKLRRPFTRVKELRM